ncbi:iron ABC transporter permease [Spiractinospora alimapuensis]|uniref:ABC transporter permease n=1 Tax=Spiractinospora alimapuensis TaxID=2820884 RepID=UPI001F3277C4|nr:iron ABC transporter permease [Spiractinospora alimapuensis]QVQ53487.1 iron ABC transporter permease [Spiractinospora alimapuensis]
MTIERPADAPPRLPWLPRPNFWGGISVAAILLFLAFLVYPLLNLVISSMLTDTVSDKTVLDIYRELFTVPYYYEALLNSLLLGACATVAALLVGVPLAYCVTRFNIPGKLFIRAAVVLTFISPPFIGAYSWVLLLGESGVLRVPFAAIGFSPPTVYGWPGLILVLTLQGLPFVFLMVSSALRTVDQSIEDAAISLGRRPFQVVTTAILPLIAPGVSTGALLVFVTSFSDIGTPAIIGQNIRVFPRLIYGEFINETSAGDYRTASALSVVLLVVCVGALLIQRWYSTVRSYGQETVRPLGVRRLTGTHRFLASAFVYLVIALACLPILTVIVTSFLRTEKSVITPEFTLDGYLNAPRLLSSLTNTLLFTTVATVVCVFAGCLIGYVIARRTNRLGPVIDVFSMIPYAVAGVVLGLAFSLTFGGSPYFLAGTMTILVLAYFIRRLPYSIRSVTGMLSQIGRQTEEASVNLGVPPGQTFWRITFPMMMPAVVSGALITWATIAREFNATIILYGSSTQTMSVEVFREVIAGNFGNASVVGTVLIAVSLVPIVILFKVLGKDEDFLV